MALSSVLPDILFTHILAAAVRTLVLAGVVGLVLSVFRMKLVSVRLFAWTAVAYVALSMPILALLMHPILLPRLPSLAPTPSLGAGLDTSRSVATDHLLNPPRRSSEMAELKSSASHNFQSGDHRDSSYSLFVNSVQLTALGEIAYLVTTVVLLFRIFAGWRLARRLVLSSTPIRYSRMLGKLDFSAHVPRSAMPRIHESRLVSVPVTIGVTKPTILLPVDWHGWNGAKLNAVITHEWSHIARRDTLSQYISLIHRAIFWFSPLPWWLNRHIAALAEEASDEAALAAGVERNSYAKILLSFFQTLRDSQGRIQWQGVSIANSDQAERRVEKILTWTGGPPMRFKRSIIAVFMLVIPTIYVTAAARPVVRSQFSQEQASQGSWGIPQGPQFPATVSAAPSIPAGPALDGVSASGLPPIELIGPRAPIGSATPEPSVSPAQVLEDSFLNSYQLDSSRLYAARFVTAQTSSQAKDFHWDGTLDQGDAFEVRGAYGSVHVIPSTNGSIQVNASIHNSAHVRLETIRQDKGITICTIASTSNGDESECQPQEHRTTDMQTDNERVDFEIQVPAGVRFAASMTHGDITLNTVPSEVHVATIDGNIIVGLSPDHGAEFYGNTVSGAIDSDFQIYESAPPPPSDSPNDLNRPRIVRATIGDGGPALVASTINGNITLRKAK